MRMSLSEHLADALAVLIYIVAIVWFYLMHIRKD